MIHVKNVHSTIGGISILRNVSFSIGKGEMVGVIGPNGSGKSTLIHILSRLLKPDCGEIEIDGKPLQAYSVKSLARKLSVVSQGGFEPLALTVQDAVAMGRYPHQHFWRRDTAHDRAIVEEVLIKTQLTTLADKRLEELSGGERQRAAIACAFAQEPEILLLDEPTTYLDIGYQVAILDLVRDWQKTTGGTAVLVLHDLNLAAQYCEKLHLMQQGTLTFSGSAEQVMDAGLITHIYGTEPLVVRHPTLDIPQILLQRSS
ncbi:ABC transporter ATP-binding protein [Aneurinibacillus sp. Ricciae_BoGa-3]|uniref:ABC transporter ATP-binding protein n=1 Tax=Aneurinibacillus sp. Ricciae_BoGa-3 TaxID=3022697 RepID=UPI002342374D|nr:ABC transporter ATP-binding protein [Aneurinibacillus sp. Ricciae_BoGa-3]WCK53952.1 ABC transporter ATP-binding protein [Aneurinibacillus sp. Ricciae_BoGa-3]